MFNLNGCKLNLFFFFGVCVQVKEVKQNQQKGEASPYIAELLRLQEQANTQGLGLWSKVCIFPPYFLYCT